MDEFTANPDSMDGDFKALLAMRRTRKEKLSEQEERLMTMTIQKFVSEKRRKSVLPSAKQLAALRARQEEGAKETDKLIDNEQIRTEAFKAVDAGDNHQLAQLISSFLSQQGNVEELSLPKTDETLLHKALNRPVINIEIIRYLMLHLNESLICSSQQLVVGGKKSKISVLHLATEHGHIDAVKLILSSISDRGQRNKLLYMTTVIVPEGQRPRPLSCLHIAAKCGYNELVTYFIKSCGMPVDLANEKKDLPILWAANDNKPDTVKLLIELGADVNGQNDKGSSALHWACRNGHTEVIKVLLHNSKTVDVNIRRSLGLVCPIIAASAMGFTEIVRLLIDHRADVNVKMKSGHTALHFAATEGHLNIVMLLLDGGALIDSLDDHGNDALLLAASHGQHMVVVFLARCGSDFNHRNHAGKTVWDFALEQKDAKMMMALVDHATTKKPEDIDGTAEVADNSAGSDTKQKLVLPAGITPLHAAATIGDNEIIRFLIEMNLDTFATDDDGSTFIHVAARHNQADTLKKYATEKLCRVKDDRGYTPIHVASEYACNEAIAVLIGMSNLSQTNHHNQTALHLAARSTHISQSNIQELVTQMILHHDWTVVHIKDSNDRSALHTAVAARNSAIIPELYHLSPNAHGGNGNAPIHIAILNGDHDTLCQLIKTFSAVGRAIDLDKRDIDGDTPLHVAAKHCHHSMVETLVRSGANLAKTNTDGLSVLHLLALQMSQNRSQAYNLMKVFDSICTTSIHWWCRSNRKSTPSEQSDDTVVYTRDALWHLFNEIRDFDGYNVLQYASKLGATEMVIAILNTAHVYKVTNPQGTMVTYDVSDLLPMTSIQPNHQTNMRGRKQAAISPSKDNESRPSVLQGEANPTTVAELLVKVDEHDRVAPILDTSPLKNIVDSYWGAYQKLYALVFVIHILLLSLYSYFSILQLGCVDYIAASNNTSNPLDGYTRSWNSELSLALGLIWPIALIITDFTKLVRLMISFGRVGCRYTLQAMRSNVSVHLLGHMVVQVCGFSYSFTAILWYVMNRYCIVSQDYVLALSLIFGWVYSINFTRGFKQVHHFSTILQQIIFRDMARFALIYLFILLAFSLSYGALTQAIPTMKISGGESIFLVFNWMIGMADFETDSDSLELMNKSEAFIQIVYASYIILSTIVLLNLLIAMMSDSYADVRQMSEVMWKVGSLQLPLEFEEMLGRSYYKPPRLYFDDTVNRWYIKIAVSDIQQSTSNTETVIQNLTERVEKLVEESRVREIRMMALLESKSANQVESITTTTKL